MLTRKVINLERSTHGREWDRCDRIAIFRAERETASSQRGVALRGLRSVTAPSTSRNLKKGISY